MKYGDLTIKNLEVLFYGLSEANKDFYDRRKCTEVGEIWGFLKEVAPMAVSLALVAFYRLKEKEIEENEVIKLVVKILVVIFSITNEEIEQKLLPTGYSIEKLNIDDFLNRLSIHFPEFFEEMTQMVAARSKVFTRIWLENINAVDTTYGHDKSVSYQDLEEFLLDIIDANLKNSNGKDQFLWEQAKEILPDSLILLKGSYRQCDFGEKENPGRFVSNVLSALTTGINVNIERKRGTFDEVLKDDFDCFKYFDFFLESLSPGLIWWVNKKMGKNITPDEIIKMTEF